MLDFYFTFEFLCFVHRRPRQCGSRRRPLPLPPPLYRKLPSLWPSGWTELWPWCPRRCSWLEWPRGWPGWVPIQRQRQSPWRKGRWRKRTGPCQLSHQCPLVICSGPWRKNHLSWTQNGHDIVQSCMSFTEKNCILNMNFWLTLSFSKQSLPFRGCRTSLFPGGEWHSKRRIGPYVPDSQPEIKNSHKWNPFFVNTEFKK